MTAVSPRGNGKGVRVLEVQRLTLKEAREARGLSRERVASMLWPPISAKTLQRWEERNEITRDRRVRYRQLAEVYEVDIRAFFGDDL